MRKIRITVCLFFVISCIVFGMYMVRTRMVKDHTPPVITYDEDTVSVSVEDEEAKLLEGVIAKDDRDGDITESVRVSAMSHFIDKGKRTITYAVFDKANQAATAQRTLVYKDYTSPKIYLTKPLRYKVKDMNSADFTENMTAEDCLDGDLTNQIHTTWDDDMYDIEPGQYSLKVQVSNSAGDVCILPLEVLVTDSLDKTEDSKYYPLLKEYIVYTSVGKSIEPGNYLTGVANANEELFFTENSGNLGVKKQNISIKSNVDYSKPGVYTVEYAYTSKDGATAVTKLFVVVEE